MISLKAYILSRNPSCTPKLLNKKTPLALEHMASYYEERERMIDYYISILKEAYAKYGYNNPFTSYGAYDERFINANFATPSMQKKMGIVHSYVNTWASWTKEGIRDYIFRRSQKYFGNIDDGKEHHIDTSYRNYFYLLALDEKIFEMYNYNKNYLKKTNSKLKHRDLIFDYVEMVLKVRENKIPENEEIDAYEIDDFLGPKGPGR